MNIPEDTTHIWTPAHFKPYVGFYYRRSCYKKVDGEWWSLTVYGEWVRSGNSQEWFDEETKNGYFVTIEEFNSPDFIPKKEEV